MSAWRTSGDWRMLYRLVQVCCSGVENASTGASEVKGIGWGSEGISPLQFFPNLKFQNLILLIE